MNRGWTAALIASGCALAACQNNNAANNTAANTAAATDLNAANGLAADNAMTNSASPMNVSATDQTFLTNAMKGDNSEVALGQLAQQKGGSQGVKDLGAMLVSDHGAHKQQVAALAQQAGVAVTDDIMDEAKTLKTKLDGLSGDAFDKQFVSAAIEDHKKDIAKYETEAKGTGPVADLAKQTLPTLKKHLSTAEGLQR